MRKLVTAWRSLARKPEEGFPGRPPEGTALAVIGDVHGYAGLFDRMIDRIDERFKALSPNRSVIVQVGDLIDRGPDSAGCLDLAARQSERTDREFVTLMGNHEVFLKACLRSNDECARYAPDWLTFGGRETVDSLLAPVACPPLSEVLNEPGKFRAALLEALEGRRLAVIDGMNSHHREGSILVTHAGVTEGMPVEETLALPWHDMSAEHWAWTRMPSRVTLPFEGEDCAFVHGHSIHNIAEPIDARFPVDTGVYKTGRLSAVLFFGDEFEVLEVSQDLGR